MSGRRATDETAAREPAQQFRFRRERALPRHDLRSPQSQRNSGFAGGFGSMKRSSGDGVKRSRSRPGCSLGGTFGTACAADRPATHRQLLGEATITEAEADQYQAEYLYLVDGLTHAVNAWPALPWEWKQTA